MEKCLLSAVMTTQRSEETLKTRVDETDDDIDESEEREARTPTQVLGLPEVVKLTAGDMHTCALSKDGSVYVWGNFKSVLIYYYLLKISSFLIVFYLILEMNPKSLDYLLTVLRAIVATIISRHHFPLKLN